MTYSTKLFRPLVVLALGSLCIAYPHSVLEETSTNSDTNGDTNGEKCGVQNGGAICSSGWCCGPDVRLPTRYLIAKDTKEFSGCMRKRRLPLQCACLSIPVCRCMPGQLKPLRSKYDKHSPTSTRICSLRRDHLPLQDPGEDCYDFRRRPFKLHCWPSRLPKVFRRPCYFLPHAGQRGQGTH
jgi:hypothetical protein